MIPLLIPLLGLIPSILHLFGASPDATTAAGTAVGIAQQITGIVDPQAAIAAVQSNPQFQAQMETAIQQKIAAIAQADAQAMSAVNTTMVAEAVNHRGYWREVCGYVVAAGSLISILATCYLFYLALVQQNAQAIGMVTPFTMAITTLLAVPGAAVGICAWHSGKVDQINATNGASSAPGQ